jgi:uncharacterized BrkB/YihY/UPF0761 family membrane protein
MLGWFLDEYLDSGASQYAAALALNLFVAMLPLTLGVLTLAGFLARHAQSMFSVGPVLVDLFPADARRIVRQAMLSLGSRTPL